MLETATRQLPGGRRVSAFLRGVVQTLRREDAPTLSHYDRWGPPASMVTMQVGTLIEAIAQDGDVFAVIRHGTGDAGIVLRRGDVTLLGVGAVTDHELGCGITIELDPRVKDQRLYGIASSLARQDTALVWLNADHDDAHSAAGAVETTPGATLVIAIAGKTREARAALSRAFSGPLPSGRSSCWYVDVDERFTTREQWLDYVSALPSSVPPDLWMRLTVHGAAVTLREGEYLLKTPWHLFLRRVYRWGMPGELSQLAVVREHPEVTRALVVASTEAIGSRQITIMR